MNERPNPLRQLVKRGMTRLLPHQLFLVRGPAESDRVCLTFDDGPHPKHTPALLDVLGAHEVRATFFVLGEQAARHPELVWRMAAEGHAVGHHSYAHGPPAQTSARQLAREVRRTRELLADQVGQALSLFRPPHGKLTAAKLLRLWAAGQTVVLWTVDPRDFTCADAAEVQAFFDRRPLEGGDIVLMHDTRPHALRALPRLIEQTRGRGLDFTTIARWVV